MVSIVKINNVIEKDLYYLKEYKESLYEHLNSLEELELIIVREDSLENCGYELREHSFHSHCCKKRRESIEGKEANLLSYKIMTSFILDFGYLDKIERHILSKDFISYATEKYSLHTPLGEYEELTTVLRCSFKNVFYSCEEREHLFYLGEPGFVEYLYSPWEYREILAVYKHLAASRIHRIIVSSFQETSNSTIYIKDAIKSLVFLEKLENLITYGMLDIYDTAWWMSNFDNCINYGYCLGSCNCDDPGGEFCNHEYCSVCQTGIDLNTRAKRLSSKLLNHDFGKDAGIDFRKLRYEKAQAEEAELDAELKLLEARVTK